MEVLEERIIAAVRAGDASINELQRKIGCNKNKLIMVCERLERQGIFHMQKDRKKHLYSISDNKKDASEDLVYIKNTKKLIELNLQSIKDLEKKGKKLDQENENGVHYMNPKAKEYLDKVIELLNALNDICASYRYLKDFDYAKEYSENKLEEIQEECTRYTRSVLRELKNHAAHFYQGYIGSGIFHLNQRIKLDQYFKEHKLT